MGSRREKPALTNKMHFVTTAKTTALTRSTPGDFLSETCRPLQGCTLMNCSSSSHHTAMLHKLALSSLNLSEGEKKKKYIKHQTLCLHKQHERQTLTP